MDKANDQMPLMTVEVLREFVERVSDFQHFVQHDIEKTLFDEFVPVDLDDESINMEDAEMEAAL
ncbi:MAG: hypothetical protein AAF639_43595 [Chloroflexota bacterium]